MLEGLFFVKTNSTFGFSFKKEITEMNKTNFEIKNISSKELEDKIDSSAFEDFLNNNLDLSNYGNGLTKINFTFIGSPTTDQPQKNEAEYDPIQKQVSLKLKLNYFQLKNARKNDVSKMMATLFLNSIGVYEQLEVPDFKKGKFYDDVESLFFRKGLLLFDE